MADLDLNDNGKTYVAPYGVIWDQVTFRKLSSGEYMRVMLERFGHHLLVQFGHPAPDNPTLFHWRWEVPLTGEDAISMIGDLSFGQLNAIKNTTAYIDQCTVNSQSLEEKVVSLANELRHLKDAPMEAR